LALLNKTQQGQDMGVISNNDFKWGVEKSLGFKLQVFRNKHSQNIIHNFRD
jgi:hypothetical protein